MTIIDYIRDCEGIAAEADEMMRERWCDAYEVLYRVEDDIYVVAAPADEDEGGDPDQPTAICCGFADEFEDAEQLYERAASLSANVGSLALELERQGENQTEEA